MSSNESCLTGSRCYGQLYHYISQVKFIIQAAPFIRCFGLPCGFNSKRKHGFLCQVLQCRNVRLKQGPLLQLVVIVRDQESAHYR